MFTTSLYNHEVAANQHGEENLDNVSIYPQELSSHNQDNDSVNCSSCGICDLFNNNHEAIFREF